MSMFTNYKNIKVHYSDVGKGPPVLLLHGFLETIDIWTNLTAILSKSYRVIAIDLPGHGKTGCLSDIHTMRMMADMVFSTIK